MFDKYPYICIFLFAVKSIVWTFLVFLVLPSCIIYILLQPRSRHRFYRMNSKGSGLLFIVCCVSLCPSRLSYVSSYTPEQCPGTCKCSNNEGTTVVSCTSGYWQEIPSLPKSVREFSMKGSKFYNLKNDSFSGDYVLLRKISLNDLNLLGVQSRAFHGAPHLFSLNMNKNHLSSLPREVFHMNMNLTVLSMENNNFNQTPYQSICGAPNLKDLHFEKNRIASLNFPPCFQGMSRLSVLDFTDNPLQTINGANFENVHYLPVRDLRLANCGIEHLPLDIFEHLQNLTYLQLSQNKIHFLEMNIFENVKNLRNIYLSGNTFGIFEPIWVMNEIKSLSLDRNGISTLNSSIELKLNGIQFLNVDGNALGALHNDTFQLLGLQNIQTLSLQQCGLHTIDVNAFCGLTALTHLKLSKNPLNAAAVSLALHGLAYSPLDKIEMNDVRLGNLDNDTFSALVDNNITEIRLDYNGIQHLRFGVFKKLTRLQVLYLRSNNMVLIDDGCFTPLTQLKHLYLTGNQLTECIDPVRMGLPLGLSKLIFRGNRITRFHSHCTTGLDNVQEYDLRDNSIEKVKNATFSNKRHIIYINLFNNKLSSLSNGTYNDMTHL